MVSFIHWQHPDTIRSLVVCVFRVDAPSTRKNIFSMADRQVTRVLSHFTDCQFWSWSLRWTHNLRSWIKIPSLNMVNKTIVYLSKRRCLSRTRLWEFPAYVPVSFLLRQYSGHQFMILTDISATGMSPTWFLSSFSSHRNLCWCFLGISHLYLSLTPAAFSSESH